MSEYKRGYSKGYITGMKRSDAALAAAEDKAKRAAQRAEMAEKSMGLGHCEDCAHWFRGGGSPGASSCAWGHCKSPAGAGTPWGAWMRIGDGDIPIVTTPRFGCVLFVSKQRMDAANE